MPSTVNGTYSVQAAAQVFAEYDHVVFGTGLNDPTHPDYNNTRDIIGLLTNTIVFGYVDAVESLDTIQIKIDQWYSMGVKGIFVDQFGYDYGVSRSKQREIVWCIHEKGNKRLSAFVNAWNVDDVFSNNVDAVFNPSGLSPNLSTNDFYLAESFAIMNGEYDDLDNDSDNIKDWQNKAVKMNQYKNIYGTKMASVTTWNNSPFDQNKMDYAYCASVMNSFDTMGFGEENFSASTGLLPFRERKNFLGTFFTHPVSINNNVYSRQMNVGISIDTTNHTITNIIE